MADQTSHAERLTRQAAADRLEAIASDLRTGDFAVQTGNKTVELHPPGEIGLEVVVRESSSMLRGARESVAIRMDWKPKQ